MVGDNRLSRASVFTDPLRDEQLGQSPNEVKVDPPGALMGIEESGKESKIRINSRIKWDTIQYG